jgi:hypothetical protein
MMQAYQNAHYDYLGWLYQQNPTLFETSEWSKYLYNSTDEFGNPVTSVMPFEYMRTNLGFVDENGNLTKAGTDFFDQMAHGLIGYESGKYSFNNFLQQAYADEKLTGQQILDWASSYNPYDVTNDSTRAASFRKMYGDTSDIPSWNRYERMPGSQQSYDAVMNLKPLTDVNFNNYVQSDGNAAAEVGSYAGKSLQKTVSDFKTNTIANLNNLENYLKNFEISDFDNEIAEMLYEIENTDFITNSGKYVSVLKRDRDKITSLNNKYNNLLKNIQSKIK